MRRQSLRLVVMEAERLLAVAGVPTTEWDVDEPRDLDRSRLLDHDILVNAVASTEPGMPFLTTGDLGRDDRRLTVVSDVTCDVTSQCNRLPVNDKATDWVQPARHVLAIDNLPSLLPTESSTAFSAALLPHLTALPQGSPIWDRCLEQFQQRLPTADARRVTTHA